MEYALHLLNVRNQLKVFHWTTERYSEHLALDKAVSALDGLIDRLAEVALGASDVTKEPESAQASLWSEGAPARYVASEIALGTDAREGASQTIAFILDEVLATLYQLQYLLRIQ